MERSEDPIRRDARLQPDPQLQLSHGRASGLQITLAALGCLLIVGMMIYGLNREMPENVIASSPPASATTGSAPQTDGGGEAPAPKADAAPQDQPPQQPVPQQLKPGAVEDDSKR